MRVCCRMSQPACRAVKRDAQPQGNHSREPRGRQPRGARRSVSRGREVRARTAVVRHGHRRAAGNARSLLSPWARRVGVVGRQCGPDQSGACRLEGSGSSSFHRAIGLLAHAHSLAGQAEQAEKLFEDATDRSTLSETSSTTPRFWQTVSDRPRRESGRSASSPRSRRCRVISADASARGFEGPKRS